MVKDAICSRLWLPHVEVIAVLVDAPDELVVVVQSSERRPLCPSCGKCCGRVHDRRDVKVRDLDSSGRSVTLVWKRRRLICDACGLRFSEHNATFEGRLTARLARQLVTDARDMTISAVARRYGLSWHTIMTLVRAYAGGVARNRRRQRCGLLLVDETSIQRRHRYVTVLVNGDTGEVLAMVAHRNKAALTAFFAAQGRRWCRGVHTVVSDGSTAYTQAIRQHIGHARHVLDRFHVIRWFQNGLVAVRRDIQRRPDGVKPRFDPDVFRARFLLLKRPDKLSAAEHERLHRLFAAHPRLKTAWDALGELHNLYLADDHHGALKALDRFCDLYSTGDIPEFDETVDTLVNWYPEILNWHHTSRPSNGRIDRTNNLLQILRRTAHGFTQTANYQARGILLI